ELKNRGLANGLLGVKELSSSEIADIEPNCRGARALFVPQTGIIEYRTVANRLKEKIVEWGGEVCFNARVTDIVRDAANEIIVESTAVHVRSRFLVNCAGLFCDRIAKQIESRLDIQIIPFRGEYFEIRKEREDIVRNLIYPVPNPEFPFLGIHFTRMIKGGVEIGPNAVLGLKREAYRKTDVSFRDLMEILSWPGFYKIVTKYWQNGMYELYRSLSKRAFLKAAQKLIPDIRFEDLVSGGAGVRAQACHRDGHLVDDFLVVENHRIIHLLNAPSPAATASLAIGENLAGRILKQF
ncbi:MAG: L-2-hydroxyglutarate oxidase, partial [Bacteriovorax sp.]